jgi:hypothetical protein
VKQDLQLFHIIGYAANLVYRAVKCTTMADTELSLPAAMRPRHHGSPSSKISEPSTVPSQAIPFPIPSGLSALIQVATSHFEEALSQQNEKHARVAASIAQLRSPRRSSLSLTSNSGNLTNGEGHRRLPRRSSDPGCWSTSRQKALSDIAEPIPSTRSPLIAHVGPPVTRSQTLERSSCSVVVDDSSPDSSSYQADSNNASTSTIFRRNSNNKSPNVVAPFSLPKSMSSSQASRTVTMLDPMSNLDIASLEPNPALQSFPELLMALAAQPENADKITFLPDGKYLAIRCDEFTRCLLPRYFAVETYEDFLSLCFDWGFTRIHCPSPISRPHSLDLQASSSVSVSQTITSSSPLHLVSSSSSSSSANISPLHRSHQEATSPITSSLHSNPPSRVDIMPLPPQLSESFSTTQSNERFLDTIGKIEVFRHPYFIKNEWEMCRTRIQTGLSPTAIRVAALPDRAIYLVQAAVAEARENAIVSLATGTGKSAASESDDTHAVDSSTASHNFHSKRRLSPGFMAHGDAHSNEIPHKARKGTVNSDETIMESQLNEDSDTRVDNGHNQDEKLHAIAYSIAHEKLHIRGLSSSTHGERLIVNHCDVQTQSTSAGNSSSVSEPTSELNGNLVDQAVAGVTHTIVTDALVTLLREEDHTRATYQKHHHDLSKACVAGIVPLCTQLFATSEQKRDSPMHDEGLGSSLSNQDMTLSGTTVEVTSCNASTSSKTRSHTTQELLEAESAINTSASETLSPHQRNISLDQTEVVYNSDSHKYDSSLLHYDDAQCNVTREGRSPPLSSLEVLGAAVVEQQRRDSLGRHIMK